MALRTTILNGFGSDDLVERRLMGALRRVAANQGHELHEVVVQTLRLGHCIGCFDCFVRTPGQCRIRDDADTVLREILSRDVLVLTGRISFGGYSASLKRMVDRVLPLLLPFFAQVHRETHHPARYPKLPRIIAIGVPREDGIPNEGQSAIFHTLVGRNAINLNAPSYAAEVVGAGLSDEQLDERLRGAFERVDPLPWAESLRAISPGPHPYTAQHEPHQRHMLTLNGSPKVGPSTSGAVATYFETCMHQHGWTSERLRLKGHLRIEEGRAELVSAAHRADLICLAFPLYVDSLHYLPTLALEILASKRKAWSSTPTKRFIAIANSGFPEAHQNTVALAICKQFAADAGWTWAGGLAIGGGEAVCSGIPLDAHRPKGRFPTSRVRRALEIAAEAVAHGNPIPARALTHLDRSPIPGLPNAWWGALFRTLGGRSWRQIARAQGVDPRSMDDHPLAP